MENKLVGFDNWFAVLAAATRGTRLWYKAPMEIAPRPIHVVRIFKNCRMRVHGGEITFTVLNRFSMKEGH
jgi:hypothetical protein